MPSPKEPTWLSNSYEYKIPDVPLATMERAKKLVFAPGWEYMLLETTRKRYPGKTG